MKSTIALSRLMLLAVAAALLIAPDAAFAAGPRMFFLHHSTGRYILQGGDARGYLDKINLDKSPSLNLWDHDYNYIGLKDADGVTLGYSFEIPDDNTDPEGLHTLWTTANAARDSILSRFDVIAFKSCYEPTNFIRTDSQLQQYKDWYLEIRDVLDQHPDKTFLILSPPPLLPELTTTDQADRARDFATWLGSSAFLGGHQNLRFFDLFDRLATSNDGSATRNMLRPEYTRESTVIDNHPNDLACQVIAPQLVDAMVAAASRNQLSGVATPALLRLEGNSPNPFNPLTTIRFTLAEDSRVDLDVYDLQGRRIRNLVSENLTAGGHSVAWDGRDRAGRAAPSGIYLYRVRAGGTILKGRMVLAK